MVNNRAFGILRRAHDFRELKEKGRRVRPNQWLILSYRTNDQAGLRCGWTVSGKVGNAVIRNRLKRWCRQRFREVASEVKVNLDVNVIFLVQKPGFYKELKFSEFSIAMDKAWRTIIRSTEHHS